MQPSSSASRERTLTRIATIAGVGVAVIGAIALLGWFLKFPWAIHGWPGLATLKASTALGLMLCGTALSCMNPTRGAIVRMAALAVLALALTTLAEYMFGWQAGIDTWLAGDPASVLPGGPPGRMALATALGLALSALSFLLADLPARRNVWAAQWFAMAGGINALIVLLGYAYGVTSLYRVALFGSVAVHTAACLMVLAIGLLLARPQRGLMGRVIADDAGGVLLRRLLPTTILLPVLFGAVSLAGYHTGLYESEFGTAVFAAAQIVVLSLIIWWTAAAIRSTDADREHATHALFDSESRLRTVIDSSLNAVISIDSAGIIIEWNRRAETMFGWPRSDALGRELGAMIVPEQHREAHRAGLKRFVATRQGSIFNRTVEMTAMRRDGTEFPVELSLSAVDSGGVLTVCGFIADITARKQGQARIQAQLARLDLLNRITHAIGERQDLKSIFRVVILRIEQDLPVDFSCICLHDAPAESITVVVVGSQTTDIAARTGLVESAQIPLDRSALARCMLGDLVYEPDVTTMEFPLARRLAAAGLKSMVLAPMLAESGVFGMLLAARHKPDAFTSGECEFLQQLTQHVGLAAHQAQLHGALQRAYDDLRQSQQTVMQHERLRALGQMASGIAHDINNAISPISLYTELMLEREKNISPRTRDNLKTIQRSIEDVSQTVARMREFYRGGEPDLTLLQFDLNKIVEQVVETTRARWNDQPQRRGVMIEMRQQLATDLPAVRGSEGEMRDALINLVFNAADAMADGGVLTITTRRIEEPGSRAQAAIEVTDTGVGMSEETRRRCMEPFFTTKGERGTGLGLAMVYGMAQRHGAMLEVDSELGKGTTMRLIFPGSDTLIVAGVDPPVVAGPVERLRILVVDDDPVLLNSLRETLESDGHTVTAADGGQLGIDAFIAGQRRSLPFDVVITDLGMPNVDGRQVAAAVHATAPETPVVMLTGWGRRLLAENDIPAHVYRVLSKPPRLFALRAVLAEIAHEVKPQGVAGSDSKRA